MSWVRLPFGARSRRAFVAAAIGLAHAAIAAAFSGTVEEKATTFARGFMEGTYDAIVPSMVPELKAALSKEQLETLRTSLRSEHGAYRRVGDGWVEGKQQAFTSCRVPVYFDKGAIDLRVVVDVEGNIAGTFIVPFVERPTEENTPKPPGEEVPVTIGDAERGLPGTLSLPKGSGRFPAVVLVHGSGPNDRDETIGLNKPFRDLAWGLATRGIAVLRYDKRSYVRPSDLAGDDLTVKGEVIDDAVAAAELLARRPEIDGSKIFVLGHSLGGTVAPRIAAALPKLAGVILLAGAVQPIPEKIGEQAKYIFALDGSIDETERAQLDGLNAMIASLRAALDGKTPPPTEKLLGAPFGYYADLDAHDPAAEAAKLPCRVLVLQGERDYQVTMEEFGTWKRNLEPTKRGCFRSYPELDHLFRAGSGSSGPHDYERLASVDARVIDDIAAWIGGRCPG